MIPAARADRTGEPGHWQDGPRHGGAAVKASNDFFLDRGGLAGEPASIDVQHRAVDIV